MVRRMFTRTCNQKAFTLIEVIVSLVLLGILAAVVGMGMIKIAEGYVFAKQNAETAQKAQIAIARIVKELGAATTISAILPSASVTGNSITYTRSGSVTNTVAFSGNAGDPITITGDTLLNNVATFTLSYKDADGTATAVLTKIRRIDITLSVGGANNTIIPFDNISVYLQEAY